MERDFAAPDLHAGFEPGYGLRFPREEFEAGIEAIKIVGAESSFEHAANLIVIADDLEFFGGAADGKVIDDDLALFEGALGNAAKLSQFEIAEALYADPDADAEHCEDKPERTASGPQQK